MKFIRTLPAILLPCMALYSCGSHKKLVVNSVAYQSVHTQHQQPSELPDNAKIAVYYAIAPNGKLVVSVANLTAEIMTIDQTMSFIVNSDGESTSYYDPTVRTQTVTDLSQNTSGASVNLGAISNALGVGGALGTALQGVNVGGANTSGMSVANTTYFADQPRVSIGPKGYGLMSKKFQIIGLGTSYLESARGIGIDISQTASPCQFSVCISYSLDGGNTFDKIVTNFYVNSEFAVAVPNGHGVNDALRQVLTKKPDALSESWWLLLINNNISNANGTMYNGVLEDYQ